MREEYLDDGQNLIFKEFYFEEITETDENLKRENESTIKTNYSEK